MVPILYNLCFLVLLFSASLMIFSVNKVVDCSDFPATLKLERVFPANNKVELSELRARDRARHNRLLQSFSGVINFPLHGSYDPSSSGLYSTKVTLGSPPREFHVQIDTGSDVLWVACDPCDNCPKSSVFNIEFSFFNPDSSSSASVIPCSSEICGSAIKPTEYGCSSQNSPCGYSFEYGDGSATSGFYVSDVLYFNSFIRDSLTVNSSARIIFGCSNSQSGDLAMPTKRVDGIFGLGQHSFSVVSQLSLAGMVPRVFGHCLKGEDYGGGFLILGEIQEPGIVYTPIVPSQPHYNLNLLSIAVGEQILPIDPSVFATSGNGLHGTIVDSGTTLAHISEEAYDPLVNSITSAVSQSASPTPNSENWQCYMITDSVDLIFPPITLFFEGGASMILRPRDYLVERHFTDGPSWCIGFQKVVGRGLTILGDLVLKDKIVIYDLARQRIGWVNYDCSSTVHVSSTSGKDEFVGTEQQSRMSSSSENLLSLFMTTIFRSFVLYIPLLLSGYLLF